MMKKSRTLSAFFHVFCSKWQLSLFLIPALVYIVIFAYYPMLGVQIAFRQYTPRGGIWNSNWVGFKWFLKFFKSYQFSRILKNTVSISLYTLVVNTPLSVLAALSINLVRNKRLKKTVQTITYIPHFISTVVLVGMITQMFNPVVGAYGTIFRSLGGTGYPDDILNSSTNFIHIYVWSGVWQNLGWNTIIYIAALSGVEPELHEAAQIDGASRLKRVFHIDFPVLLPTMAIMLILQSGSVMNIGFEKIYLMQNNRNLTTSEVISTYVYKTGMSQGTSQFSYATAIGLFNSVINCLMLLICNKTANKLSDGSFGLF